MVASIATSQNNRGKDGSWRVFKCVPLICCDVGVALLQSWPKQIWEVIGVKSSDAWSWDPDLFSPYLIFDLKDWRGPSFLNGATLTILDEDERSTMSEHSVWNKKEEKRNQPHWFRILFPSLFYDNRTSTKKKKKNRMASFRSTHSNQPCPSVMDIPFLFLKSHHTKQFSNIRCPRLCFVSWKPLSKILASSLNARLGS